MALGLTGDKAIASDGTEIPCAFVIDTETDDVTDANTSIPVYRMYADRRAALSEGDVVTIRGNSYKATRIARRDLHGVVRVNLSRV